MHLFFKLLFLSVTTLTLARAIPTNSTNIYALKSGADSGDSKAQYELAGYYSEGLDGLVVKDKKRALKYYIDAFESGYKEAANDVADIYYDNNTSKDYKKSLYWFRKSAENNDSYGQYSVAYMFEKGEGTEVDFEQAFVWYKKAAEQNDVSAQLKLAECYLKGGGVRRDFEKAFSLYAKIMHEDDGTEVDSVQFARHRIARFYLNGVVVPKDQTKGMSILHKLADEGHQFTIDYLHKKDNISRERKKRDEAFGLMSALDIFLVMPFSIWFAGRILKFENRSFRLGTEYFFVTIFIIPFGAGFFASLGLYAVVYFGSEILLSKIIYKTNYKKATLFVLIVSLSVMIPIFLFVYVHYHSVWNFFSYVDWW